MELEVKIITCSSCQYSITYQNVTQDTLVITGKNGNKQWVVDTYCPKKSVSRESVTEFQRKTVLSFRLMNGECFLVRRELVLPLRLSLEICVCRVQNIIRNKKEDDGKKWISLIKYVIHRRIQREESIRCPRRYGLSH